ncbi:MAG: peptidylprolyl isomerase [Alphaproteobacteria bacterium]|nr:peptidylprolyl isomerase [Alphaproteobacteria bacterium]
MADTQKLPTNNQERGNAVIAILVVLLIVAVGAIAYLSTQMNKDDDAAAGSSQVASSQQAGEGQTAMADSAEAPVVEPGNPVVAKVAGQDITRLDVFNFIQTLPPQTQQLPVQQLFPLARAQVVNASVINKKAAGVNLDNDPLVKQQMAAAKDQIVKGVYVQKQVQQAITEERIKEAYDKYVENFPKIPEVKVRHILVEDKDKAEELTQQIKDGADFAELAKEHSTDATKENGGELGYISKEDQVIPAFMDKVFELEPGEMTEKPLKTEFGYHIIEVTDARDRPPEPLERATPFLAAQLRGVVLNEIVQDWRDEANVQLFDINGNPIEPAAGDEEPAEEAAPEAAAEETPAEEAPAEEPAE